MSCKPFGRGRGLLHALSALLFICFLAPSHADASTPGQFVIQHNGVAQFCATGSPSLFGFEETYNFTGSCGSDSNESDSDNATTIVRAPSTNEFTVQHNGATQFCATGVDLLHIDGPYNFTGICGQPAPDETCVGDATRERLNSITVGYSVLNTGNLEIDAQQFEPMFGRGSTTDQPPYPIAFPGVSGTGPVIHWTMPNRYLSQSFLSLPSGQWLGSITFQSNNSRGCFNTDGSPGPCGQPYMDVSISTLCNDFNPATALRVQTHMPSDGSTHFSWQQGFPSGGVYASLAPNTAYHLNIRFSDPNDYWHKVYVIWYGSPVTANLPLDQPIPESYFEPPARTD